MANDDGNKISTPHKVFLAGTVSVLTGVMGSKVITPDSPSYKETVGEKAALVVANSPDADTLTPAQAQLRLEQAKSKELDFRNRKTGEWQTKYFTDIGEITAGTAALIGTAAGAASIIKRRRKRDDESPDSDGILSR